MTLSSFVISNSTKQCHGGIMKKFTLMVSKSLRDFLKLKATEETLKQDKPIYYDDILKHALKTTYGKEFSSFVKGREKK
jgi:hypothetical protein